MDTKVTQTNTTSAVCVLSHADLVKVLGLAVAVDAGLRLEAPGTIVTVDLDPSEVDGEFSARVAVLIDHNFVPPAPASAADVEQGSGTGNPSLKSDAGQPVVPPAASPAGLQIPGAPAA